MSCTERAVVLSIVQRKSSEKNDGRRTLMKPAEYAEPRKKRLEEFREKVAKLALPQEPLPDEVFSCQELRRLKPEIQELYRRMFRVVGGWIKGGGDGSKMPWLEEVEMAHLEKCVSCQYDLLRC